VAFAITDEPRFTGVGDGRQERYDAGCAVMANVELTHNGGIDVLIYEKGSKPAAPQGSNPPQSAFR
jgi:hypothetical protein